MSPFNPVSSARLGFVSRLPTLVLLLCAALASGCDSHADTVCENVGDCEQGGDSEWIAACQDEAQKLSAEADALGCNKAFDAYYDCADAHYRCHGATATFPNCAEQRSALESCLSDSKGKNACDQLLERKAACETATSKDDALPPEACTLTRDCTARCYLDQVGDACTPSATELERAEACSTSCPP
jgi:hypothetical protein